jgi:1-acyl-sn-glycerol-3-phosphate acyltransferase
MGTEHPTVWQYRWRFVALWIAHVARAVADVCFLTLAALAVMVQENIDVGRVACLMGIGFAVPFILAAPVYGALASHVTIRGFLVVTSSFCALVAILAGFGMHGPNAGWICLFGIVLHGLGSAASGPARYALLWAVAKDALLPLPRVMGWMQMGTALCAAAGLVLGQRLWVAQPGWPSLPGSIGPVVLANIVATIAAYGANFPSDRCLSPAPASVLPSFFGTGRRIVQDRPALTLLLSLTAFVGILTASAAAMVASLSNIASLGEIRALPSIGLGLAVGSLLASMQRHPYRGLGLVPLAGAGLVVALAWGALSAFAHAPPLLLGAMAGLIVVPLRAAYQATIADENRGNSLGLLAAMLGLGAAAVSVVMLVVSFRILGPRGTLWLLAGLTALGTLLMGRIWRRELIEQVSEIVLAPIYRVHGHGPGLTQFPARCPFLVVANHAAWFDPLWLGKIIPRPVYPMMTSRFYDLPVIRWLMKSVVHAIRVPEASFRREAPELKEAVAVLDRGQCLVIFPEGAMKRKDEKTLRQFGQGVWRILQERPQTPVMACWIEGGWGCFLSYWNGPPTKNKRFDFWRRIEIGFGPLQILPAEVLEDQRAARGFLMHACLDARQYLGLPTGREAEPKEPSYS